VTDCIRKVLRTLSIYPTLCLARGPGPGPWDWKAIDRTTQPRGKDFYLTSLRQPECSVAVFESSSKMGVVEENKYCLVRPGNAAAAVLLSLSTIFTWYFVNRLNTRRPRTMNLATRRMIPQ
jgi:hypothetical protein